MPFTFFCAVAVFLNIVPGPSMLYVAQQTMQNGLRAGGLSIAGILLGTLLHIIASMMGITIAIAQSSTLFTTTQLLGAIFLIYLGISQLLKRSSFLIKDQIEFGKGYSTFLKGMIINLLNPKIIIFFIALLPQFIDPQSSDVGLKILLLGSIFGMIGCLVNLGVTFATNFFMQRSLQQNSNPLLLKRFTQSMSLILILFGSSIIFKII